MSTLALKNLSLQNLKGECLRLFAWDGADAHLVKDGITNRLHVTTQLERFEQQKRPVSILAKIDEQQVRSGLEIPGVGRLVLADQVGDVAKNIDDEEDTDRLWLGSLLSVLMLMLLFLTTIFNIDTDVPEIEEELKQHVVKIIKQEKLKPRKVDVSNIVSTVQKTNKPVPKKVVKKKSIKRMGALSVLGQLNKGKTKGGLDLGAVQATAGPGLGGTGGSGGVQTSLYGKGIVAAPVGPGANIRGGGGYGTKGKGGGKAGYGKVSLVGSSGAASIGIARESIVQGGLDQSLIAQVIQKNLGQITFCYEKALQSQPNLSGRVAVNFTIGGNGSVKVAGVKHTTLHSKLVEDCILLRLRTWKFPLPEGGVDVRVSYPFLLKRTGQG